jgi:hypothetical protein
MARRSFVYLRDRRECFSKYIQLASTRHNVKSGQDLKHRAAAGGVWREDERILLQQIIARQDEDFCRLTNELTRIQPKERRMSER